jgi:hypothetical protein
MSLHDPFARLSGDRLEVVSRVYGRDGVEACVLGTTHIASPGFYQSLHQHCRDLAAAGAQVFLDWPVPPSAQDRASMTRAEREALDASSALNAAAGRCTRQLGWVHQSCEFAPEPSWRAAGRSPLASVRRLRGGTFTDKVAHIAARLDADWSACGSEQARSELACDYVLHSLLLPASLTEPNVAAARNQLLDDSDQAAAQAALGVLRAGTDVVMVWPGHQLAGIGRRLTDAGYLLQDQWWTTIGTLPITGT